MADQLEIENKQLIKEIAALTLRMSALEETVTYLNQRLQEQTQILAHQWNIISLQDKRLESCENICKLLQSQIDELKH